MTTTGLTAALIAAQKEFPGIPREATGQARGGKYRYATLPTVLDAVVPVLNKHGVVLIQRTGITEGGVLTLNTILRHTSGEEVESLVPLPEPSNWQDWGIAMTYARRYTLTAILGIAPEDDDDAPGQSFRSPSADRAPLADVAKGVATSRSQHGTCPDHGIDYFMAGKMRNPAHKLDDGSWCDKPDVQDEYDSGLTPKAQVPTPGAAAEKAASEFWAKALPAHRTKEAALVWALATIPALKASPPSAWTENQWAALTTAMTRKAPPPQQQAFDGREA
jgi:hypothetical protein